MAIPKRLTPVVHLIGLIVAASISTPLQCSLSPSPLFLRIGDCTIKPSSDQPNGVQSWGIQVSLASPAQNVCLQPSLVVNNTVIMADGICTNDHSTTLSQCISRRGGVFHQNETSTNWVVASQDGLALDLVWTSFNPPFAGAANASIRFASDISLSSYPIAVAVEGQNSSVGQLGLANNSVFLRHLSDAGLSTVPAFGFLAGSQSVLDPRPGHLILGGYDAASLDGPFSNFTISNTTTAGSRVCPLQVEVQELVLSRPGLSDLELISDGTPMTSCIEPLDRLFRFPRNVLRSFQQNTGWTNDSSMVSNQLFVVEPGLYYNTSFNGTLRFKLKNGLVVEIPTEEIAHPLRGLDPNGKMALQNNVTVVNIFDKEAPEGTAVLGQVFLSAMYLTVNYLDQSFRLAPAVSSSLGALDLLPFNNLSVINCSSNTPDRTYIGVIVIGCALAIVIAIIVISRIHWFRRFYPFRWQKESPEMPTLQPSIEKCPVEKEKCAVVTEARPPETVPPPRPVELHDRPRGSVAIELDPSSPSYYRKFSGTTEFSHARSNSEQWNDQISPIRTSSVG